MGLNVSTELNSTTNQLKMVLGSLGNNEVGSLLTSGISIWNSFEQVKSKNTQTQTAGVMNIISEAMNLIQKIGNLQAAAKSEVDKNSKEAKELIDETKKTEKELKNNMEEQKTFISSQNKVAKVATEEMEKAQEELNKTQEQINEIIKQIEEKQAKLAAAKTPEEEQALLEEIYGLGKAITDLTLTTKSIQEAFDASSEAICTAYENIETAKGNVVEIQTEGQAEIVASAQKATKVTADTTATQASGVKEIALAESINTTSAVAAAAPGVGAVLSTAAAQKAIELKASGTTKTTAAPVNFQTIAQGIGGIENNTALLSKFENAIGKPLAKFDELIGGWNNVVTPLITSLGTLGVKGTYAVQANALSETVLEDKETIAKYQEQNPTVENTEIKPETSATISTDNNKKPYELGTPKFKFGI